jgi:hypothetical protein
VLFAEAPAESYLDIGDRVKFDGSGLATNWHHDFGALIRESDALAYLVITGPVLMDIRDRLSTIAA